MSAENLAPCAVCGTPTRARVVWPMIPDDFTPLCRRRECRSEMADHAGDLAMSYREPPAELLDQIAVRKPSADDVKAEAGESPWFRHPDGPEANGGDT